jgi:uroporphyrinogen decarboxylase
MTSRERVAKAFRGEQPDRVPIHESFWQATANAWRQQGLPADASPDDYFETEIRLLSLDNSFGFHPEEVERTESSVLWRDEWGVLKRDWLDHRSTPELLGFPIASRAEWEKMKSRLTPDAGRVDWTAARRQCEEWRAQGKFICLAVIPGYEAAWRKIGPEAVLTAIAQDPSWVVDMYERDADMIVGTMQLYLERGFEFDGAWLWDDLAYKNGPLFSPRSYREQLLPSHKRVVDVCHRRGWPVILHSCGDITSLVPHLLEAGFDCLQALEVKAGVDLGFLTKEYGRDVCFMGGVDVRALFADDPSEMEDEVKVKLDLGMSSPRGYIFHSDHSLPPQVTFDRYRRIVDLVRGYGVYR